MAKNSVMSARIGGALVIDRAYRVGDGIYLILATNRSLTTRHLNTETRENPDQINKFNFIWYE